MKIVLVIAVSAFFFLTSCSNSKKGLPTMGSNFFTDEVVKSSKIAGIPCWVGAGQEVKTIAVKDGIYEVAPINPTERCPDGGTVSTPANKVRRMREATHRVNTNHMIQSNQRENKAGACELFEGAILVEIFTTDLHQPNIVFVVGRNPYSDEVEKQFACPVGDRLVISKDDKNIF